MSEKSELNLHSENWIFEKKVFQMNWDDLSSNRQKDLVKKYGDPVVINGIKFEIEDQDLKGVCDANEKSLGAMDQSRTYWGYYSLSVVNNSIIHYNLATMSRVLSAKIIVGGNGGMIIPGIIYAEDSFSNEESLGQLAYTRGTQHQIIAPGERGTFRTLHLSSKGLKSFKLSPVRDLGTFEMVTVNQKRVKVGVETVRNIVGEAKDAAILDEDKLYSNLHQDLPAYFESKDLVHMVKTKRALVRDNEVGLVSGNEKPAIIPREIEVQAILDPISFNNHGQEVYIINYKGKFYFCPKEDIQ